MARGTISVEVRVAWWVRWYVAGVSLFCKLTGLEPDLAKVLATAERGITVPGWRPRPSLRHRIAAAYERSAWARLAVLASALAVFWIGMAAILLLAPLWVQPLAAVAWMLLVGIAFSCLAVGPREDLP